MSKEVLCCCCQAFLSYFLQVDTNQQCAFAKHPKQATFHNLNCGLLTTHLLFYRRHFLLCFYSQAALSLDNPEISSRRYKKTEKRLDVKAIADRHNSTQSGKTLVSAYNEYLSSPQPKVPAAIIQHPVRGSVETFLFQLLVPSFEHRLDIAS